MAIALVIGLVIFIVFLLLALFAEVKANAKKEQEEQDKQDKEGCNYVRIFKACIGNHSIWGSDSNSSIFQYLP